MVVVYFVNTCARTTRELECLLLVEVVTSRFEYYICVLLYVSILWLLWKIYTLDFVCAGENLILVCWFWFAPCPALPCVERSHIFLYVTNLLYFVRRHVYKTLEGKKEAFETHKERV